mmetsp:Transcript_16032/g.30799  ORF Transcript_16032/g.30799 Transcript_16032/m.30799 type:complete len:261 (-) Transcript_16032:429-1211(-)|eukprot:CAMPEP_0114232762 /NCGR_PEP_ID=MMETSP0058-20121206/4792_1 /TAXON_ID=36894 /ORGANISM="Pyramimonas parkeae, CCMP726" /LENGTH=260 /DNA_ID=CAMNT_0001344283 /DNA_START=131 /DNA_END=913 /DNA_ORIENTATION=+
MSSVRKRVAKGASLVQIDDLENEGGEDRWTYKIARIRASNFALGLQLTRLEGCIAVQGTAREELKERMQRVKTQDDVRRSMLALQRDILANLSEGSNDHNKSVFFTECYNFTSLVDRFSKALERSLGKHRKAARKNQDMMQTLQSSTTLSEAERTDALCHCEDIARMHMEREKESSEIQETMSGVIAELRAAALVVAQEGNCDQCSEEVSQTRSRDVRTRMFWMLVVVMVLCFLCTWAAHARILRRPIVFDHKGKDSIVE